MPMYEQDIQLIEKVQQGDEEAFRLLIKKYEKLVYYIVLQNVRNTADASDIVQETFIQVKKSIHTLNETKYFKAWLNRIAFSKTAKYFHKKKDILIDEENASSLKNVSESRLYMLPEKQSHFETDKEMLHWCLQQLKPIYRDVLMLRYFEELSMNEIAIALNIPEGTVKSRLNLAKSKLREQVEALEASQGIVLDFKAITLEAMIAALFLSDWEALVIPKPVVTFTPKKLLSNIFLNPLVVTALCGGIGIATVSGVVLSQQKKESAKEPVLEPIINHQQMSVDVFPKTMYNEKEIYTARDAYIALYEFYIAYPEESNEEVRNLNGVLQSFGGSYAEMSNKIIK